MVAGCADEGNGETTATASSDSDSDCRTVTETRTDTLYDEIQSINAGGTLTWNPDLERGDQLTIDVTEIDGARPALEVEDSSGTMIADIGPSSNIRRTLSIDADDRYYITLENEALMTSGQWDIVLTLEREYEEEVCN
ncbi:hypothetical protein [Natronorubrum texcoconense]|uniref:hypothetical protein n=1 Tax=Natronorubrum texcoconense TaxID=1095776 RepID=UPI000B7FF282|nr:hypothetical protein [Natronorubrum texcoconense]